MAKRSAAASPPPDRGYATALRRIERCRVHRDTALDLRNLGLTRFPPELFDLEVLTSLNLTLNFLTSLPPEIARLKSLEVIGLGSNRLRSLPDDLVELHALASLDLTANPLETLPAVIPRLAKLRTLSIDACQLTSLPAEIGALTSLQTLSVEFAGLTSLPAEIGILPSLKSLHLTGNTLTALPPAIGQLASLELLDLAGNQLRHLPPEIGRLTSLVRLDVRGNGIETLPDQLAGLPKLRDLFLHANPALGLSPSILGADPTQKTGQVSAKSILDFYFSRRAGKSRPLNELKLILVGRGGAGKTSAARALRDLPFRDKEESTPGIALADWTMTPPGAQPVTVHVWDFAGQVITHALHQFFFSERSVYVLVLTGRENSERDDAEYWLRLIKAFGSDDEGHGPPVIVVLNKWDLVGARPHLDRGALQERYSFIRGFVEMDCKSGKGVARLKTALRKEVQALKWVREPFPEQWDAVRRALSRGRSTRAHMTYAEYRALCVRHGVRDEDKQDSLAEILHNLGAALNYRTDPRLREATVLQPEWLTRNVYAIMRRAEKQTGVLKPADVTQAVGARVDAEMQAYLLTIMERFEIAYAPKASGVWLVPQALPDTQPKGVELFRQEADATRLRYTYPALPEGLVARTIVRMHEFIEEVKGQKQQWASGAVLTREGARALIRAEKQDRRVTITVIGPQKARQQLAGLCQSEMRDVHSDIPGLDPLEETQVLDEWVPTATLEGDERRGQKTGVATKDGTVQVDPTETNNAYSEKRARSDDWKPTVFISYSKSNVPQRKRLESELKILKNEGLVGAHWHDRMIDPGDQWDAAIQSELSAAHVVVILASAAALSTDYITDHEIPKAMELHQAGKTVVVPLVLEACRWDKTALGALHALPEKAKPLNKWKPQSDAWKTVGDGLARLCKKLMDENRGNISP